MNKKGEKEKLRKSEERGSHNLNRREVKQKCRRGDENSERHRCKFARN